MDKKSGKKAAQEQAAQEDTEDAPAESRPSEEETETDTRSKGGAPPNSDAHSPAHPGEEGRVRARLAALFKGVRDKDAPKVCSILTRETRRLIGSAIGQDCKGGMEYAFGFFPQKLDGALARIRITKVAVTGQRATATVRYPDAILKVSTLQYFTSNPKLRLVKEGGEWRVPLVAS